MTETPLIAELLAGPLAGMTPLERDIFRARLELHWPDALRPLRRLYGDRLDFDECCRHLLAIVAAGYVARPAELRLLDQRRQSRPDWFQQPDMLGYVAYADPVSYTHLDVYKRQEYPRRNVFAFGRTSGKSGGSADRVVKRTAHPARAAEARWR